MKTFTFYNLTFKLQKIRALKFKLTQKSVLQLRMTDDALTHSVIKHARLLYPSVPIGRQPHGDTEVLSGRPHLALWHQVTLRVNVRLKLNRILLADADMLPTCRMPVWRPGSGTRWRQSLCPPFQFPEQGNSRLTMRT